MMKNFITILFGVIALLLVGFLTLDTNDSIIENTAPVINLWDSENMTLKEDFAISSSTGLETPLNDFFYFEEYIEVDSLEAYTIQWSINVGMRVYYYDSDYNILDNTVLLPYYYTFTTLENTQYIRFGSQNSTTITIDDSLWQLEIGTINNDFVAYVPPIIIVGGSNVVDYTNKIISASGVIIGLIIMVTVVVPIITGKKEND